MSEEPSSEQQIQFGTVHITQYKRQIGGSCGVPEKGKYPLGLSFEVVKEESMPFEEYVNKYQKKDANLHELNEKKRKKLLLENCTSKQEKEKLEEYDDSVEKEIQKTMKRIDKHGCRCRGVCGKDCPCVKKGYNCIYGVCSCSDRDCQNIRDDDPCIGTPYDDTDAGQRGILIGATPQPVKKPGVFN